MNIKNHPVVIIGAGPVGMAAAAHLALRKIPFMILESGKQVGSNLLDWGHVRMFSPWKYNIDKAAEKLLAQTNWQLPDMDALPTGSDIVSKYLLPLSFHPKIEPWLQLHARVISITRLGIDKVKTKGREGRPFIVRVQKADQINIYEASAIIDASGTWQFPNPLGAGGIEATGEREASDFISYRIPDISGLEREKYAGKKVMVAGSGHSAINSLLELARIKEVHPSTELHWVLRNDDLSRIYGGKEEDALEARGALGSEIERLVKEGVVHVHAPYLIHELKKTGSQVSAAGFMSGKFHEISGIDEIIANTGSRPGFNFLTELRVTSDPAFECVPALASLIDPNIHSCGTVRAHGEMELRQPEPGLYVVGAKSYGRAPTFLMATGYEQVRSIVAFLDGDLEAARRVELDLPETGVCGIGSEAGNSCCGSSNEIEEKKSTASCCGSNTEISIQNLNKIKMEKQLDQVKPAEVSCCGGAPTSNADACCKLDEEKKEAGEGGCGCSSEVEVKTRGKEGCC